MGTPRRERAEAVQRMQDFIEANLNKKIALKDLALAAGYSPCHASRVFSALVGIPVRSYIASRRLTVAAACLRDSSDHVGDVALRSAFGSHEGFTRAFAGKFGSSPAEYRATAPPVPWFMPRSALCLYHFQTQEPTMNKPVACTVFVHHIQKPQRVLILERGRKANDYFAYCEEQGCDVWGTLASLTGTLGEPAGYWLPESLRVEGTSVYVMGVEAPMGYSGPIPQGMETVVLEPTDYLVFQGQPYPEDQMSSAISAVWQAIEAYNPEPTGWIWAQEAAPSYQLAPMGERGYIEARPVTSLFG